MGWKSRNITAVAVALSMLLMPAALAAKEKRGARLRIEKTDGTLVEGELLKVSGETLVLFNDQSQQGIQMGLSEVRSLGVRRKRNVLVGMGIGLSAGLIGPLLGGMMGKDRWESEMTSFFIGIISVPLGMLVGGLASGLRKPYRTLAARGIQEKEREELLAELEGLSREERNKPDGQ